MMAKTKRKTHKESEHKHGIIREQAKLIKSLKQQLRQYQKYDRTLSETLSEEEIEEAPKRLEKCDECGKGHYEEFDAGIKIILTCNVCSDRKIRNL